MASQREIYNSSQDICAIKVWRFKSYYKTKWLSSTTNQQNFRELAQNVVLGWLDEPPPIPPPYPTPFFTNCCTPKSRPDKLLSSQTRIAKKSNSHNSFREEWKSGVEWSSLETAVPRLNRGIWAECQRSFFLAATFSIQGMYFKRTNFGEFSWSHLATLLPSTHISYFCLWESTVE